MKQAIMFLTILNCILFCSLQIQAAVTEIAPKENQHLIVVGADANVFISGAPQSNLKLVLDATAEDEFQIEENDQVIRLQRKPGLELTEKKDAKKNRAKIEIIGKVIPVEVHLQEGNISVSKWGRDLFLHVQKGKMNLNGNQSLVVAHAQKGEISIANHKGKVIIDTFQAALVLKDLLGDVDLQSYQGDSTLDAVKGSLFLHTTNGATKLTKGSGSLQFEIGKGSLMASQFQGRIEGQTNDGSALISLQKGEDVNLKTQTGKLTVNAPANSALLLNAVSIDGELYGPQYLKLVKDGSQKILKGRMKGEPSENSIQIRAQEGVVVIR